MTTPTSTETERNLLITRIQLADDQIKCLTKTIWLDVAHIHIDGTRYPMNEAKPGLELLLNNLKSKRARLVDQLQTL